MPVVKDARNDTVDVYHAPKVEIEKLVTNGEILQKLMSVEK